MLKDIRFYKDPQLLFAIVTAAAVVDTAGLFIWKQYPREAAISQWYDRFGIFAYILDVTSMVLGVVLTQFATSYIGGRWSPLLFCAVAVAIQQLHDLFFALAVVPVVKNNDIMDLMKVYAGHESSWLILVVDAIYMVLTSLVAMVLYGQKAWVSGILLCFTLYVTGYAMFTHAHTSGL
jgi:hypothetical protein